MRDRRRVLSITLLPKDSEGRIVQRGTVRFLSRWIVTTFETFLKFQSFNSLSKKVFFDRLSGRRFHMETGAASCIYQALNTYLSRRAKAS